jgi:hypothetical protein
MINLFWLFFAHFVGDIALQSSWQADNKGKYWYVMLSHCMIWTGMVSVALQYIGILSIWKIIFLLVGHFIGDEVKSRQAKTPNNWWMIYPDQAWHFIQLIIVWLL